MTTNPVRESTRPIVNDATYVSLNKRAITAYAHEYAEESFEIPTWDGQVFISETGPYTRQDVIDYFMVGNVVNFCFNTPGTGDRFKTHYGTTTTDTPITWDGAFGMWACLKKCLEDDSLPDLLDADCLANLTMSDAEAIFEPSNGVRLPLLEMRVEMLRETGHILNTRYNGTFSSLLTQSNNRLYNNGDGFVEQLVHECDVYTDEWPYNAGSSVRFDKRAQLAVTMLYDYFYHKNETVFTDVPELTVFADYRLPTVLRRELLIEYHPGLAYIIDSNTPDPSVLQNPDYDVIDDTTNVTGSARTYNEHEYRALAEMLDHHRGLTAGSRAELEIRAATVQSGELLMTELNRIRDEPVYVPALDFFLWNQMHGTRGTPHTTETTAY